MLVSAVLLQAPHLLGREKELNDFDAFGTLLPEDTTGDERSGSVTQSILFNPHDPQYVAAPHAFYARLRQSAPVSRATLPDGRAVWLVTAYAAAEAALGDPRLVKDVAVLDEVTYAEAAELAYNGAKVLHPRTLAPLVEKQIPVWSKNSFAPHKPGTKIVSHFDEPKGARAVSR